MAIAGISFPLSMTQAEFLVDHIDTVRPITTNALESATRNALLARSLIRYCHNLEGANSAFGAPKGTVLTDKGREVVCAVLAHYADQLVRARVIDEPNRNLTEAKIRAAMLAEKQKRATAATA